MTASRPHFFAFPVGAALAGANTFTTHPYDPVALALVCGIAGLGWGVGQLLNDLFDRDADQVDAPHRPGPLGLLPSLPTLSVAVLLGLALTVVLTQLHPWGLALGAIAALLIGTYNRAKAIPVLGNLAHALVIGLTTVIGAAATHPHVSGPELRQGAQAMAIATGSWAAIYLQANYEKDLVGDARGGYLTLAHVLGIRSSALLRAAAASVFFFCARDLTGSALGTLSLGLAVLTVILSALDVGRRNTQQAALKNYRWAVHGGIGGMLSLGANALTSATFFAVAAIAVLLTENAFRRSPNP